MVERVEIAVNGPSTEFSLEFLQGMVNRMMAGFHKYGKVADVYPDHVDAISSARERIRDYAGTGNTEFLMDAANFLMAEYMQPRHPNAHFRATDSDESSGRVLPSGEKTQMNNERIRSREEL